MYRSCTDHDPDISRQIDLLFPILHDLQQLTLSDGTRPVCTIYYVVVRAFHGSDPYYHADLAQQTARKRRQLKDLKRSRP